MSSFKYLKFIKLFLEISIFIILIDETKCQDVERKPFLQILPIAAIQRKPVGQSLLLSCQPNVSDISLVTDLQWRDNLNNSIQPKASRNINAPPMYTDTLPDSLALIITSLTESMGGDYYCTASYANTEYLTAKVVIETYVAITWKDAPEYQYPTKGEDYKVRCEVTANPAPTVDWIRNGDQIKNGGRYIVETHGLTIRKVQESDDGEYICRAAVIQTGELVERIIRVEVQIKPEVIPLPESVDAVESQVFSLKCNATGKPPPRYTWIKDFTQQNVANADRFSVNPLNGLLTINPVHPDDYGTYTCRAENNASQAESNMLLNVLVRPRIYEFINITTAVGRESMIICKASGRPPPEIVFRRYGTDEEFISGYQPNDDRLELIQRADELKGESNGTLRIFKVKRSDDGLYECIARNRGDSAHKVGHITVEFKPTLEHMKVLPPVFTWEEKRANLSCMAQAIPNATIEWRWQDRRIKELHDPNLVIVDDGARSDLLITPKDRRYYTAYKCIATNIHGQDTHAMQLKEARLPDVIPAVRPTTITATTMTFEITAPATEFGLPILAFYCQFKEQQQPDWKLAANRSWSPESPHIVEGLKAQTAYDFRFAARNIVGIGNWGGYVHQSTPRRSAPEEPRTLHVPMQEDTEEDGDPIVISPYADHFELRWNIPNDNGEPITFYEVKYCPGQKINDVWNEIADDCVTRRVHSADTSFEMNPLQAETLYRIELRANNAIGASRPANLFIKTARGQDVIAHPNSTALSSGIIIAIAIGSVLVILIIVDLLCCATMSCGLTASLCRRTKRSPSDFDEETKLGRDENTPLNIQNNGIGGSIMKQNSTVEYDGRMVTSRSGDIIGKNSAV